MGVVGINTRRFFRIKKVEKSAKDLMAIFYCSSFSSTGTSFSAANANGKVRTGKIFKPTELLLNSCRDSRRQEEIEELQLHCELE